MMLITINSSTNVKAVRRSEQTVLLRLWIILPIFQIIARAPMIGQVSLRVIYKVLSLDEAYEVR
jgi:hypothetical protein